MLTRPQSGDRGGGASLTPGGLYHMLLDNTETCVNSHMVAPTGYGRGTQLQIDFDKLPATKVKLKPRLGTTLEWNTELLELSANLHLTQVINDPGPPTQKDVAIQFANDGLLLSQHELYRVFGQIAEEWWHKNTVLYHVVKNSLDISGPFFETDTRYIRERFWIGDQRDGNGLLRWALTHGVNSLSVMAQSKLLNEVQQMKLTANPTYDAFAEHCTILLQKWRQIQSNSIDAPAAFYYRLLDSIPDGNESGKLGKLRSYLADKMADMDPSLNDVVEFVNRFCQRALNIGMPQGPGQSVNPAFTPGGAKQKCKHCPSRLCRSPAAGGGTDKCICCNSSISIPKSATDGQRDFVLQGRDYLKVNGKSTLKGVKPSIIREWKIGSKREALNATGAADDKRGATGNGGESNGSSESGQASASGTEGALADALQLLLANEALKGGDSHNPSSGFGRAGSQQSLNMMLGQNLGSKQFLGMHAVAWSSGSNDGTATDDSESTGENLPWPYNAAFSTGDAPVTADQVPSTLAIAAYSLVALDEQCGLVGCMWCRRDYQEFETAADRLAALNLWHARYAQCIASRAIAFALAQFIATEEERHMVNERAEHIAKVARIAEQARSGTVVLDCSHCDRQHGSDYICAPSVGMLPHPPSLEKGGCGNSSCEMACNCATRDYFTELEKRRALVRSHQSTTSASGSELQSAPSLLVGASPHRLQQPAEDGVPSQGGLADIPEGSDDEADAFSDAQDGGVQDAVNTNVDHKLEQMEGRLQDVITRSITVALAAGSAQSPSVHGMIANPQTGDESQAKPDDHGVSARVRQPPGSTGTPGVHYRSGQRLFQTPVPDTVRSGRNAKTPDTGPGSPLDAFRGGMLGAWYAMQQGGKLPQRLDLNDQSSSESSQGNAPRDGNAGAATWPGAKRPQDDPPVRTKAKDSAAELMARAQLSQASHIKTLQSKIANLEAGTALSRFVKWIMGYLKRAASQVAAQVAILDGKSLIILILSVVILGPRYGDGFAKALYRAFSKVITDFLRTMTDGARVRLAAALHSLLIRLRLRSNPASGAVNGGGSPPPPAPPAGTSMPLVQPHPITGLANERMPLPDDLAYDDIQGDLPRLLSRALQVDRMEAAWNAVAANPVVHEPTRLHLDTMASQPVIHRHEDTHELGTQHLAVPATPGFLHPGGVRISEHGADPAVLPIAGMQSAQVLCDDGATIDCSVSGIGRLPGTFCKDDACSISIGDANASLQSNGSYYHAVHRYDAAGRFDTVLIRMADTPNGIADIFSEAQEVDLRNTTITWRPREGRKWHTQSGKVLTLSMTKNRLGCGCASSQLQINA